MVDLVSKSSVVLVDEAKYSHRKRARCATCERSSWPTLKTESPGSAALLP